MDAALLIGNGLNRCYTEKKLSWEKLMEGIAEKYNVEFKSNNSFPLEFECMANSICNHDNRGLDKVIRCLKKEIAEKVKEFTPEDEWVHKEFLALPIQEIMTTNYDYYLEQSLDSDFPHNWTFETAEEKNRESKFSKKRRYNGANKSIRHIHGEAGYPNTICLGYDHYASTLIDMKDYLKSRVNLKDTLSKNPLPSKGKLPKYEEYNYGDSWMELFFTHDVHIVGLSLDVCEIDLWWLLTYRAKLISLQDRDKKTINNKIYFYYTTSTPQKDPCEGCANKEKVKKMGTSNIELFKRLHVECVEVPRGDEDYEAGYKLIAEKMKQTMEVRKSV